jgi:hypothetical protein
MANDEIRVPCPILSNLELEGRLSAAGARSPTTTGRGGAGASGQVDAVAALLAVALLEEGVIVRDGDGVDESGAEVFAGAAGGEVVGIAGDPEGEVAVGAGEGEEQAAGAFGEVVAAGRREDVVAEMAEVHFDGGGASEAEADGAGDADGGGEVGVEAHPEGVAGDDVVAGIFLDASAGVTFEEGEEGLASGGGLLGHVAVGEGVTAGEEHVVEVARVGLDELELGIDEGEDLGGAEEAEGGWLHGR